MGHGHPPTAERQGEGHGRGPISHGFVDLISGLTFGGPDVRAWSWQFVPDDADAIRFTDQDGRTSWQRPQERLVIFPDTVADDPDGDCACRLDAIDIDGAVIVSVDVKSSSYTND